MINIIIDKLKKEFIFVKNNIQTNTVINELEIENIKDEVDLSNEGFIYSIVPSGSDCITFILYKK